MGLKIDGVSLLLQISKRVISRYVQKFNAVGNVNTLHSGASSRGTGYNGSAVATPGEDPF